MPKLSERKKREKPRGARTKFVQQLQLRAIDERKQTQQELLQLMQQITSLLRKEQKLVPAYQRRFKDENPRSVFYYRMLRRIGLPEVHARFAPWFLKSNQIQMNRWSSVLFARLEQAFYARPEELTTLEKIMREHQTQYDAIMKAPATRATRSNEAKTQKMEPREQSHKMLVRAFRDCSFRPSQEDSKKSQSKAKAKEATMATIQAESDAFVDRLEVIPEVAVRPGPPGLAPQVRGQLESHGRHVFFHYNGRWKDGEMHGSMGVYTFSDGGKYRGEWKHNEQAGAGTVVYPNGVKYTGAFADGKFHGFGIMEMPGTTYEGHFKHGLRCGMGKLTFTQSATFYDGEFYGNMRHGKGTETNALGYAYHGVWHQNRIVGPGKLVCPDKAEVFKETWPRCVLGEAIRLVKRERADAVESEETWYRRLLRVRDDLRALDLQYAHWDAEEARMNREDDERIEALKKARREKREAQAAAKKAFFSNEAAERDDKDDEDDDEDDEEEGDDEEDEEGEDEQGDDKERGEGATPESST
uniref:MORN repeat-containing protein 5 n=1 Tax=Globisporangium ultimum (strain ATCC 200006 / CBS 805.95 / DAOM BR144) TaxID=431595 RepID=K3WGL2_GLOUD